MKAALISVMMFLALVCLSGCERQPPQGGRSSAASAGEVDQEYTLTTRVGDGRIVYVGIGGDIDGLENPDLVVKAGETIKITLINGDGMPHDLSIPDFGVKTTLVSTKGRAVEVRFAIPEDQAGKHAYSCTQPGHRQAGQEGSLIVQDALTSGVVR